MHKPIKYVEKAVTYAASAAWAVFDSLNQIHQNPGFVPKWSDKPLLKSWEKIKPPLGWPRDTDSLCPRCVPEIRQRILDGKEPIDILYNSRPGEIKAKVIEREFKRIAHVVTHCSERATQGGHETDFNFPVLGACCAGSKCEHCRPEKHSLKHLNLPPFHIMAVSAKAVSSPSRRPAAWP